MMGYMYLFPVDATLGSFSSSVPDAIDSGSGGKGFSRIIELLCESYTLSILKHHD